MQSSTCSTLQAVAAELVARGIPATLEYPGFVSCSTDSTLWLHAGFVNGSLGIDLVDLNDNLIESMESDIPDDCQDVARIANHIAITWSETNAAVSRW